MTVGPDLEVWKSWRRTGREGGGEEVGVHSKSYAGWTGGLEPASGTDP